MTDIDWGAPPPKGYWRDARGNLVHQANLSRTDQDMDATTRKIHAFGGALSDQMWRFRQYTLDDIYQFVERVTERYGGHLGGRKGNVQLTTFDGCLRVQLAQAEHIVAGPEIAAAQAIVEECIDEWSKRSSLNLKALVNGAFKPDATGRVSVAQLLRLRRVEIDDGRWREAQRAIGDALRPVGKAEYVRLYRRANPTQPWEQVPLHLATVRQPEDSGDAAAEVLTRRVRAAVEEGRAAGVDDAALAVILHKQYELAKRRDRRRRASEEGA